MSQSRLIALPCKIFAGIVPDERAFEVKLKGGGIHSGVAPVHYFWDERDTPIPAEGGDNSPEITGKVAARLLEKQNGTALVSIPDGSAVSVDSSIITGRPSEIIFHVPVRP